MNKIRNILVPVDFSKESKNALASAILLARETNARLIVLHVFDETGREYRDAAIEFFATLHGMRASTVYGSTLDRWLQEKSLDLHNFIENVRRDPDKVIIEKRVEMGNPIVNIMRTAKEENADLIVLAIKPRRFLTYVIGRSILLKLALRSRCPVLLIGTYPGISALPLFRRLLARDQTIDHIELGAHTAHPEG